MSCINKQYCARVKIKLPVLYFSIQISINYSGCLEMKVDCENVGLHFTMIPLRT